MAKDYALLGPFTRIKQAEQAAKEASRDGVYTYLVDGLGEGHVVVEKRLHVHAPADAMTNNYWLNGIRKTFTDSQKVADQLATPALH